MAWALIALFAVSTAATGQDFRQRGWTSNQTQEWLERQARKRGEQVLQEECQDFASRRDAILNGNRITTQIQNFGSISSPGNTISDIVWNGLGYGYEFGPFVAAEIVDEDRSDPKSVPLFDDDGNPVLDDNGEQVYVMRIVSDGLTSNGGETSPDGSEWWGWQPIPCAQPVGNFEGIEVVNPNSDLIPTSTARDTDLDGQPDSWPDTWFNENLERYVWPGALQQGASNADQEALYFMNDYNNKEFRYFPFPGDSTRKGLGLEVEVRLYQWANPLAEDVIFLIYKITNKSEEDLKKVIFGMWGDPHIGGPGDWADDLAFFDQRRNLVYAWDADGRSDIPGRPPGYFGYKFLESPGVGNEILNGVFVPGDGIDNDGDGMVDESWTDGIDNDEDWDPELHDVGVDGLDGTGDLGEGDGVPTAGSLFDITLPGEPNFEFTDIDESDQIGLTSFASPPFGGNRIADDERVWSFIQPGDFDEVPSEPGDYVFIYGSGSFELLAGQTKRFSIALIVGENLDDLFLNAETAQTIYDVGYRFARPPTKPIVRAVPGDGKVTLYWDDKAESSFDPLSREYDFEGYVIYRSTDHEFSDQQSITDINGSKFLFRPLTTSVGVPARFDLDNGISGPSPIPYPGRGVTYDLGRDTGLFHTFVDSNKVVNGQTYYYAVASYDRGFSGGDEGSLQGGIPPSETSKTITFDPTDESYIFDDNTIQVVPGPRVAGYVASDRAVDHVQGPGTGGVRVDLVDDFAVPAGGRYRMNFEEAPLRYSVLDDVNKSLRLRTALGKATSLQYTYIDSTSFVLRRCETRVDEAICVPSGQALEYGVDYELNAELGTVTVFPGSGVNPEDSLDATFKYAPVFRSALVDGEEANLIFDGLHLFVEDDPLEIDFNATGWTQGSYDQFDFDTVLVATSGPGRIPIPADYEIVFFDEFRTTSIATGLELPFEIFNLTRANQQIEAFVPDINRNGVWDIDEQVIFVEDIDGSGGQTATWQVHFREESEMPGAADVFFVRTRKPFTSADIFEFGTEAATTDDVQLRETVKNIYVVPNPYVATNELEPRNSISRSDRGDRRLYFANLPAQCTIRIYTLAGELVDTIEHKSTLDDGKAFWDLRTKDNMTIAYGLYLFHVEARDSNGKVLEQVGKFAVIK